MEDEDYCFDELDDDQLLEMAEQAEDRIGEAVEIIKRDEKLRAAVSKELFTRLEFQTSLANS